jgi:hypothetical protein
MYHSFPYHRKIKFISARSNANLGHCQLSARLALCQLHHHYLAEFGETLVMGRCLKTLLPEVSIGA